MALSGKELESHKAKRLVARNEMIGAAQVHIQRAMLYFDMSRNVFDVLDLEAPSTTHLTSILQLVTAPPSRR